MGIIDKIKAVWDKVFKTNDVKKIFGIETGRSSNMDTALSKYKDMRSGIPYWCTGRIKPTRFSNVICREIANLTLFNADIQITGNDELQKRFDRVMNTLQEKQEESCATCGMMVKSTSIYFAVEAKNKDKVEVFRTSPATGKTKETIDTDTEIEDTYADVILDLISRVDTLEKEPISEEKIEKSVKSYLEKNPIEETDPTVPEWAKAEEKPTYTAEEVGALPDTTKIPKNLSNLQDDAEHRTVTDTEKQSWNNKSNFSGNYEDLQGKPTIPTVPTKLPNPQSLTITYGGKEYTYDGSEAITITIETGGIERIEKLSTDTAVTLEPNKLYVFPEMESLTYTIGEGTGEVHFIFKSGATATRVVHPDGVNIGSFYDSD